MKRGQALFGNGASPWSDPEFLTHLRRRVVGRVTANGRPDEASDLLALRGAAHGATNKEHHVCARRRAGEAAKRQGCSAAGPV
jgi:hypothetical protein